MAGTLHTYGPTCRLGEQQNQFIRRASEVSSIPPKVRAQFFYSSLLPIDDPLSPTPSAGGVDDLPSRPFSSYDNVQLEKAWLELDKEPETASVPAGLNRLHTVEMPALEMRPIYWSPIHDVSSVIRATWFYKDKMTPVPTDIANLLEVGYQYMKPWTETYADEMDSCLNVGPEAELKLVHRLFPSNNESRPSTAATATGKDAELTSHVDSLSRHDRAAGNFKQRAWDPQIKYRNTDGVIYANAKEAQILRPNQFPSARGKKGPLADVRKGKLVGISVVRGFDHRGWLRKQPIGKLQQMATRELQRQQNRVAGTVGRTKAARQTKNPTDATFGARGSFQPDTTAPDETIAFKDACEACLAEEKKPAVNDLVLVIHGIGQKLSEKVESYHFTHSINAVRRQFAIELDDPPIRNIVRQDLDSVMVLPVNWRSRLDLGEEAGRDEGVAKLADITPESIPSVRSLVSDVLLDIPYYLSHHKPKMIEAVVKEANRIYRLWCQNNPGFHGNGRVHLIAHSLGSVMAMDILSSQPTHIEPTDDAILQESHSSTTQFDFNTTNLFFAGSPAGLFLLLNQARLKPRRARNKPGADQADYADDALVSEEGTYGCLAVDNLYNIVHHNDPIAYKLNATVDIGYAATLQQASVPTSAASWSSAFNNMFWSPQRRMSTSLAKAKTIEQLSSAAVADLSRRPGATPRLPSAREMETRDFDAEEVAEKKMYLLNDNGQIDWYISSGGTLEFQYLDMLGAHSSYWILQDFVRFVLIEVGRAPGRAEVIEGIRSKAKKIRDKKGSER